jgi:ribulose-phosphate 3-epimerase
MSIVPIVPAVIPVSVDDVKKQAQRLSFSHEFHLDIVDGQCAPKITWPYEPVGESLDVKSALDVYTLEVDLMVSQPIKAAIEWVAAGADMLVFHVETLPLEVFKNFAHSTEVSIGVSCSGDTPLETLEQYLPFADYVQLMGIHTIGSQGQPFDEAVLEKISYLKQKYPQISVTVDGSVNHHTIQKLKAAGADRFIVGSAITLQANPEQAHNDLRTLINGERFARN